MTRNWVSLKYISPDCLFRRPAANNHLAAGGSTTRFLERPWWNYNVGSNLGPSAQPGIFMWSMTLSYRRPRQRGWRKVPPAAVSSA